MKLYCDVRTLASASPVLIDSLQNHHGTVEGHWTWNENILNLVSDEISQQAKALAAKSEDMSSVPGIHMVKRENHLIQILLISK